jgi:hypothetical protein
VTSSHIGELTDNGYTVIPSVVDSYQVDSIGQFVMNTVAAGAGTRRLIETQWCRDLADRLTRNSRICESMRWLSNAPYS